MKIRNGFVSNSSSSSFIVNYKTTLDCAKDAIKVFCYDEDETSRNSFTKYKENLEKLKDINAPILIDMSDDLRIWKKDDVIYMTGTNHYDWDDYVSIKSYHDEGEFYDIMEDVVKDWYYPEYALFGHSSHDFNWWRCDECKEHILVINGTAQCPVCRKMQNGKYSPDYIFEQREGKLNRVLNQE